MNCSPLYLASPQPASLGVTADSFSLLLPPICVTIDRSKSALLKSDRDCSYESLRQSQT